MSNPPKAQRLQRMFNENEFDTLTEEQAQNLVDVLQSQTRDICKVIKDNVPFKIEI